MPITKIASRNYNGNGVIRYVIFIGNLGCRIEGKDDETWTELGQLGLGGRGCRDGDGVLEYF